MYRSPWMKVLALISSATLMTLFIIYRMDGLAGIRHVISGDSSKVKIADSVSVKKRSDSAASAKRRFMGSSKSMPLTEPDVSPFTPIHHDTVLAKQDSVSSMKDSTKKDSAKGK